MPGKKTFGQSLLDLGNQLLLGDDGEFTAGDAGRIATQLATIYGLTRLDDSDTLKGFFGSGGDDASKQGYQGEIPYSTAIRSQVPNTYDPLRRPGSGGQRYFSDMSYVPRPVLPDTAEDTPATTAQIEAAQIAANAEAQTAADTQADLLAAGNLSNLARQGRPPAQNLPEGGIGGLTAILEGIRDNEDYSEAQKIAQTIGNMNKYNVSPMQYSELTGAPLYNVNAARNPFYPAETFTEANRPANPPLSASDRIHNQLKDLIDVGYNTTPYGTGEVVEGSTTPFTVGAAKGGLMGMYLGGPTDGMADRIPAQIEGGQEARLSDGEFVVPADVVSHLGNGNSNSGAEALYDMMGRIRTARTGNPKQGRQINPSKYMPR